MDFIVLEPVKVAGKVRKPGEILGEDLLSEELAEQLLTSELIAGYEGGAVSSTSDDQNGTETQNPQARTRAAAKSASRTRKPS